MPATSAASSPPELVSVGFTVSDLERATAALSVLDFRVDETRALAGPDFEALTGLPGARAHARKLSLGSEHVELTAFEGPIGRRIPPDSRSNDGWFEHIAIVVSDMDAAYARLANGFASAPPAFAKTSPSPQTIPLSNPGAGGIRALYFKDFDGHNLELIWYPRGKGRPSWQSHSALFLGIDHTAIATRDTAQNLRVYKDALGLNVAGSGVNFGVEQAALSGVANARVHITGLTTAYAPGVEFLEYEAPRDGRSAPPDSRPNDLWHWEMTFVVTNPADMAERIVAAGGRRSSVAPASGVVLVEDRDGHVLKLVSR